MAILAEDSKSIQRQKKRDIIYMYVLGYRFLGRPLSFFS